MKRTKMWGSEGRESVKIMWRLWIIMDLAPRRKIKMLSIDSSRCYTAVLMPSIQLGAELTGCDAYACVYSYWCTYKTTRECANKENFVVVTSET